MELTAFMARRVVLRIELQVDPNTERRNRKRRRSCYYFHNSDIPMVVDCTYAIHQSWEPAMIAMLYFIKTGYFSYNQLSVRIRVGLPERIRQDNQTHAKVMNNSFKRAEEATAIQC